MWVGKKKRVLDLIGGVGRELWEVEGMVWEEEGGGVFGGEEWRGKLGVGERRVLKKGGVLEEGGG